MKKLSSTRYSQIVFYLLTCLRATHRQAVILSYSPYHLFANTQAGTRFATKTRQAIAFEQIKTRRTDVIVYAGGTFEIFETLSFVHLILALSLPVQARLRPWLEHHLPHLAKIGTAPSAPATFDE